MLLKSIYRVFWKLSLLSFSVFILLMNPAEAAKLTLAHAINLALVQNRELIEAGTLLETSQADLDMANAEFDIQIQPEFTEQRVGGSEIKSYGVTISKKLATGGQINLTATRGDTLLPNGFLIVQPSFSLSLQQPLFKNAGSKVALNPVNVAKSALIDAKRKYAEAREDLVLRVVNAYVQLHELEQQVKLDKINVRQMTELSQITREYILVGRAKTLDALRTDFQLDETRAHLTADQQRLSSAQAGLAELLGMPSNSTFETATVAWPDYETLDPEQAVKVAFANRLNYAQAVQGYDDTVRALDVARNQTLPGINLTLGYQRYSSSPLPGNVISAGGGPYVSLSGDIGANYASEKAAVRKADAQREAALEQVEIVMEQITTEVQQNLYAYQEARTEYTIAKRAAADAEARLQLAQELFHMGRADSFAVTDASTALISAQSASLNADMEVVLAGYKLSQSLGTLLSPPDELKPKSQGRL
ncbi:MAG: TolC family protein [Gammaproteobacteria bacterium]